MGAGGSRPHEDLVRIGRVAKVHGNDGRVYVDVAAFPGVVVIDMELRAGERDLRVAEVGGTPQRPLVRFEGLCSRDGAVALKGTALYAERTALPPLGEGEWYGSDLEGLRVEDRAGRLIGHVRRVVNGPSTDVIEVRLSDDGELLVPLGDDAVLDLDVTQGRMVVDRHFLALDDAGDDAG